MNDDLEIDVDGVPMPAWLMSRPDQVVDIHWDDADGNRVATFTFEHLFGNGTVYHCTWPRHASMIYPPDPQHECGWSCPTYDEQAFVEHAKTHLDLR